MFYVISIVQVTDLLKKVYIILRKEAIVSVKDDY